jgi:hypothetical protein
MRYRNRSIFQNKTQTNEFDVKKSSQLIGEFLNLYTNINSSASKNASSLQESPPTNYSLEEVTHLKIEYLKAINKRFKSSFHQSYKTKTSPKTELSAQDAQEFRDEIFRNKKALSKCLILNIIQPHSNTIRLLTVRIILYLSHFKEYHQELESLNLNAFIIRQIDLDTSNEGKFLEFVFSCRINTVKRSNFKSES